MRKSISSLSTNLPDSNSSRVLSRKASIVSGENYKFLVGSSDTFQTEVKIEDARVTKVLMGRIRFADRAILALSVICLGLSLIEYEFEFEFSQKPNDIKIKNKMSKLLTIVSICSSVLVFFNIFRMILVFNFQKEQNMIEPGQILWTEERVLRTALFSFIIFCHPNSFFFGEKIEVKNKMINKIIYYYINDIFHVVQLAKTLLIVRSFLNSLYYSSSRAHRICSLYGCENNEIYAVRVLMRRTPFVFTTYVFLGGILLFGYALKVAEAPLSRWSKDMDHSSYFACCWETILVMTTVGYGDIYPRTMFGRIVIFFCSIYGVTVVSLMVVTITNTLEMTDGEIKAYVVLEKLSLKGKMKEGAASIVGFVGQLGSIKKLRKKGKLEFLNNLARATNKFKSFRRNYDNIQYRSMREEFDTEFIKVRTELDIIKDQVDSMIFSMKGGSKGNFFKTGKKKAVPLKDTRRKTGIKDFIMNTPQLSKNNSKNEGDDIPVELKELTDFTDQKLLKKVTEKQSEDDGDGIASNDSFGD